MRRGELTPVAYLQSCLARIDERESVVRAFAHLDADAAMDAARNAGRAAVDDTAGQTARNAARADAVHAGGEGGGEPRKAEAAAGLLCSVPIGVKDVIEAAGLPTEYNSPLYAGHRSSRDAACVGILRTEGAIVLGKTTTVEFASLGRVAPTTNPHDPRRTPGGSSSGSAAAVAAGMVPIALGTQTGGSTIRPASFCGVAAMKPTYGTVSVDGMRPYAPSLDTVTWMARSVEDLALVARALRVFRAETVAPARPRIGVYRTSYWDCAGPDTRDALAAAAECLRAAGASVVEVDGPGGAERLNEAQDTVMHGEGRAAFLHEYLRWPGEIAEGFREEVENAKGITADALRWACDYLARQRPRFDAAMSGFDAWLTPAIPGEAPPGLESTGDAVFNRLWTGLHVPAITLPGFCARQGMPVGIQLVGRRFSDAALLAAARFVESAIAEPADRTDRAHG